VLGDLGRAPWRALIEGGPMPRSPETTLSDRLAARAAHMLFVKPAVLRLNGPILAAHGCRATYYVTGGLVGQHDAATGPYPDVADLQAILAAGHELGCHSFSHPDLLRRGLRYALAELDHNRRWLTAALDGYRPRTFA
jgi:hypothetical protein